MKIIIIKVILESNCFSNNSFEKKSNSNEYMKIQILRIIRHWDLAVIEVMDDDKMKGNDSDYTAGVLLAKDLR